MNLSWVRVKATMCGNFPHYHSATILEKSVKKRLTMKKL